jgi:thioredoxin-like negative regulator of GroEL
MQIPFPVEVIDADENKDILQKYNVRSIPVLILLDENNNEIDRLTGSTTKDKITALLNKELL